MLRAIKIHAKRTALMVVATLFVSTGVSSFAQSTPKTHALEAHRKIQSQVRSSLLPNIESYQSIGQKVLTKLEFSEKVEQAVRVLDTIRHGAVGKSLESGVAGAKWVTMAWDELRELVHRIDHSRRQLEKLKTRSTVVANAANVYLATSDQARFDQLVTAFMDSTKTFEDAAEAFLELRRFLGLVTESLATVNKAITTASVVPILGKYADELKEKLGPVSAKLAATREVLKLAANAVARDKALFKSMQSTLAEALAQDAFDEASAALQAQKLGSALSQFVEIQQKWPETQWAKQAATLSTALVKQINDIQQSNAALRSQVNALEQRLENSPQDMPRWLMTLGLLMVVAAVGIGIGYWRRTHQKQETSLSA